MCPLGASNPRPRPAPGSGFTGGHAQKYPLAAFADLRGPGALARWRAARVAWRCARQTAALEGGLVVTNCTRWGHTLRNYAFFARVQRVGTWLNRSALLDDDELAAAFAQPLWRVCFGGAFAATRSQIWARRAETWRRLSDALSRGNNIEEGHYSERLWGLLLAPPLTDDAAAAMLCAGHAGDSTTGLFKSCKCDAKYEACLARPQVR